MASVLYFGTLVSMLMPESSLLYLKFFHWFCVLSEHPNISSNSSILFVHLELFSFFSNYGSDNLYSQSFPGGSVSKESAYSTGDLNSIPGSGRSLGGGNGTLF